MEDEDKQLSFVRGSILALIFGAILGVYLSIMGF